MSVGSPYRVGCACALLWFSGDIAARTRQELLGGFPVTLLDLRENSRDVAHGRGLQIGADAHDYRGSLM